MLSYCVFESSWVLRKPKMKVCLIKLLGDLPWWLGGSLLKRSIVVWYDFVVNSCISTLVAYRQRKVSCRQYFSLTPGSLFDMHFSIVPWWPSIASNESTNSWQHLIMDCLFYTPIACVESWQRERRRRDCWHCGLLLPACGAHQPAWGEGRKRILCGVRLPRKRFHPILQLCK